LRLVVGGWFVLREKYCWLVADKPSEQAANPKPQYLLHRDSLIIQQFVWSPWQVGPTNHQGEFL
jgi:predicted metal-dependent enzyme (double-stranded beta helix superfamily)